MAAQTQNGPVDIDGAVLHQALPVLIAPKYFGAPITRFRSQLRARSRDGRSGAKPKIGHDGF